LSILLFSYIFPFLLTVLLLQRAAAFSGRDLRGWGAAMVFGFAGAGIVLMPVGGLPIGRWLISFNANFSIPLSAILFSKVFESFFGMRLLDEKALRTGWMFSILAGAVLYPMAMGLGRWDPYAAGWGFSWLFILAFLVTVALLAMRNRFAGVLVAAILACDLHLLESANFWDYLIDPILVAVSCIALGKWIVRRRAQAPMHKT